MNIGPTTSLERTNLEAHVDLCAERYRSLDIRLNVLENKMDAIQKEVLESRKSLAVTIITSSATIVASVLGLIVTILLKF